ANAREAEPCAKARSPTDLLRGLAASDALLCPVWPAEPRVPFAAGLESRRVTEEKGPFARRAASTPAEAPPRRMNAPAPVATNPARTHTCQVARIVRMPSPGSGVREERRRFLKLATTGQASAANAGWMSEYGPKS